LETRLRELDEELQTGTVNGLYVVATNKTECRVKLKFLMNESFVENLWDHKYQLQRGELLSHGFDFVASQRELVLTFTNVGRLPNLPVFLFPDQMSEMVSNKRKLDFEVLSRNRDEDETFTKKRIQQVFIGSEIEKCDEQNRLFWDVRNMPDGSICIFTDFSTNYECRGQDI
jgi:hypothetical protein